MMLAGCRSAGSSSSRRLLGRAGAQAGASGPSSLLHPNPSTSTSTSMASALGSRRYISDKLFIRSTYMCVVVVWGCVDMQGFLGGHKRLILPPLLLSPPTVVPASTTTDSLHDYFRSYGPIRDGTYSFSLFVFIGTLMRRDIYEK